MTRLQYARMLTRFGEGWHLDGGLIWAWQHYDNFPRFHPAHAGRIAASLALDGYPATWPRRTPPGQTMLAKISSDIRWAEAAGRSVSTINRLWRKYFQVEDALKAFRGGW